MNDQISKQTKPIIRDYVVIDPMLPGHFDVNSVYFAEWLQNQDKIRVEFTKAKSMAYSLYKDNKGYWTAQKRVQGKLQARRLGNSDQLAKIIKNELKGTAEYLTSEYQTKDGQIEQLTQEIRELELELSKLTQEKENLLCQLETKSNTVQQSNNVLFSVSQVIEILEEGLKLKANTGGKIKTKIREAITLIKSSNKEI